MEPPLFSLDRGIRFVMAFGTEKGEKERRDPPKTQLRKDLLVKPLLFFIPGNS
jgi:hypothetical protein